MSSSFALKATVLIALDAHDGHWCSFAWLLARCLAPRGMLAAACEDLVHANHISAVTRADGSRCYGVHVSPESPVLHVAEAA